MPRPRKNEQAERMYTLYQEGYSLAQVGLMWGVSRQSVYDVFQRRGWVLRSPQFLPTVTFNGETYTPDPDGYFRKTRGNRKFLHQDIWEHAHGPIPPGNEIHHSDHDKTNNALENLVCLTATQHAHIHHFPQDIPAQPCLECGALLTRKRSPSGHLDTPAAVRRRRYCNAACHSAHMRGKPQKRGTRHEATERP